MARPDTDMLNSCPCSGVCNGQLFSMSTACLQQFMGQLEELRGVISTFFLGGAKDFFIFQCHRTIEKLEKNSALYVVI